MSDYARKLQHPKWQRVSAAVKEAANWRCENCGSGDRNLQVHHSVYLKNKEPWEYESDTLICLCEQCHKERQNFEKSIKIMSARARRLKTNRELHEEIWELVRFVSVKKREIEKEDL